MALTISHRPSATPRVASPAGLGFLNRIRSNKDTYKFPSDSAASLMSSPLRVPAARSTSWDPREQASPRTSLFSVPAQEGAGVKARRLSITTTEELKVETCDLDDEFVSASKFGLRKECGKGASATVRVMVRRGDKKGDGRKFAVKEFRKRSSREGEDEYVQKVKSEYAIAKSVRHPNIVETVRLCTHGGRWNHVMEYCAQGELFSLVDRRYMKTEDKVCIFKQVLTGVEYLHDHGIAHRDIKLENLLMTDEGYIKITDFGISEVFRGVHPGLSPSGHVENKTTDEVRLSAPGVCGSRPYISPEVLAQDKPYDPSKLDVWSCGILYMTLVLNGNPWQTPSIREPNFAEFVAGWNTFLTQTDGCVNENNYPQCGRVFNAIPTNKERRCIFKMLHPDPEKRCSVKEVLSDRWIKSFDCCSPDSYERPLSGIDVSKCGNRVAISRMKVQAKHDHLPPPIKRLPQHRFDMGDGTSRYD